MLITATPNDYSQPTSYTSDNTNITTSTILDLYKLDGFQKLCDVTNSFKYSPRNRRRIYNGQFFYENIDQNLMYSYHTSWVYMIVSDNEIVKIGETGQPLGIRKKGSYGNDGQPLKDTSC